MSTSDSPGYDVTANDLAPLRRPATLAAGAYVLTLGGQVGPAASGDAYVAAPEQ